MSTNINTLGQSILISERANPVFTVLVRGEIHRIQRREQFLHVINGQAWVSFDGQDFMVEAGATLRLEAGSYPAVISSLGQAKVVYELY